MRPASPSDFVHWWEVPVVVPHGRTVRQVIVDGRAAERRNTHMFHGIGHRIENWHVQLPELPHAVIIEFEDDRKPGA